MGLFLDEYERLGMLDAQAHRAARLIVDTGIHALAWDRDRSISQLEEAGMGPKVRQIRSACGDRVGVLEGWGGEHMLELFPAGIVGIMPGLALIDVLGRVWDLAHAGEMTAAYTLFARVHTWIAFSLRSVESLNYLEKTLLVRRGVLRASHVRRPTVTLDADSQAYADLLVERMLAVVADLPAPSAAGRPAGP